MLSIMRVQSRKPGQVATTATARKMLKAIYWMLEARAHSMRREKRTDRKLEIFNGVVQRLLNSYSTPQLIQQKDVNKIKDEIVQLVSKKNKLLDLYLPSDVRYELGKITTQQLYYEDLLRDGEN